MSSVKICDYIPKTGGNQCGLEIQWNQNLGGFESVKFPGFKHQHRLTCRTDGCGGDIFFHDAAPKNPKTGRAQPLEIPIPVNRQWVLHAHKKIISADAPVSDPYTPVPSTPGVDPSSVSVAQAQNAVVNPQRTEDKIPEPVASTAQDPNAPRPRDVPEQLELALRWQRDVLQPLVEDMKTRFERVIGPIEAWVSIMANAGFKTAADIKKLGEDLVSKSDEYAEQQANLQKNSAA